MYLDQVLSGYMDLIVFEPDGVIMYVLWTIYVVIGTMLVMWYGVVMVISDGHWFTQFVVEQTGIPPLVVRISVCVLFVCLLGSALFESERQHQQDDLEKVD